MKIIALSTLVGLLAQSSAALAASQIVCTGAGLTATFSGLEGIGASVSVKVSGNDQAQEARCTSSGGSNSVTACSVVITMESGIDFVASHIGSPEFKVIAQAWDMSGEGPKTTLSCQ